MLIIKVVVTSQNHFHFLPKCENSFFFMNSGTKIILIKQQEVLQFMRVKVSRSGENLALLVVRLWRHNMPAF